MMNTRWEVAFLGNGATEVNQELVTKKSYHLCNQKTGMWRHTITKKFLLGVVEMQPLFFHDKGECVGYFAMRKRINENDIWEWYCTDKRWHDIREIASDSELKQYCFAVGKKVSIARLGVKRSNRILFVAQWKNIENGETMNCGYWVFRNPLMAHALGISENGKKYQNTKAAFERSYNKGYRYFEVDLALTMDKKLVCCHGWTEKNCSVCGMNYDETFDEMSYDKFMQQTVDGDQTLDIDGFVEIMKEYPDTYFEIDFHKDNVSQKVKLLLKALKNDQSLMDRLLIQAQGRPMFKKISKIQNFLNVQIIAGAEWVTKMEQMIDFAIENGVCTIALRKDLANDEVVRMIQAAGLYILAYTVDEDVKLAKELLANGVSTICTDRVCPKDIE